MYRNIDTDRPLDKAVITLIPKKGRDPEEAEGLRLYLC